MFLVQDLRSVNSYWEVSVDLSSLRFTSVTVGGVVRPLPLFCKSPTGRDSVSNCDFTRPASVEKVSLCTCSPQSVKDCDYEFQGPWVRGEPS